MNDLIGKRVVILVPEFRGRIGRCYSYQQLGNAQEYRYLVSLGGEPHVFAPNEIRGATFWDRVWARLWGHT